MKHIKLLIQTGNLGVFQLNEFILFVDFILSRFSLSLILVEHSHERVDTVITSLLQVLNDFLAHFYFLFVLLQLGTQLLCILDESFQIFLLSDNSVINFFQVVSSNINLLVSHFDLVDCLGHQLFRLVILSFRFDSFVEQFLVLALEGGIGLV